MLFLRIKQAECALADGRLDVAFALVQSNDVRQHRNGQELIGRVGRALVNRGQEHLKANRFHQAGIDAEKAGQIAGNIVEIAELKSAIATSLAEHQTQQRRRSEVVAAAWRQIDQGQLTVGAQILAGANTDETVTLMRDVAARRAIVDGILTKAADALSRDDWQAAIDELSRATRAHPADARLREMSGRILQAILPQIKTALDSGRLDVAMSMLQRLERVDSQGIEIQQVKQVVQQCQSAWQSIQRGEFRTAEQTIRRLATLLPNANWIEGTLQQLEKAASSAENLRSGPISLLANAPVLVESPKASPPLAMPFSPAPETRQAQFTLHVDGIGTFRVLPQKRITIGPVSSSRAVDLPLLADASLAAVTIERDEEDYILRSSLPVMINDKPTLSRLLHNGDRIALSPKCRLTFSRPNAASTTAVLHVSGARLPRNDARAIILLDREIVLGGGPGAHVRDDTMPVNAFIQYRDGELSCRAKSGITINDAPAGDSAILPIGAHIAIDPMSFVITRD